MKRGFTLIELLVVIAVIGTISVLVTVSFSKTLKEAQITECKTFVKETEDGALVYAALKTTDSICNRSMDTCNIKLSDLAKEGLISSEKNPCTNKETDYSKTVTVTWTEEGEKKAYYNGEVNYER